MISKGWFVARFLLVFALLIVLGAAAGGPHLYATALARSGAVLSPAINGWALEEHAEANPRHRYSFRRGTEQMRLRISLEELATGLLPLLALIGATPGIGLRRLALVAPLGIAGLFTLDLLVLVLYPYLVLDSPITNLVGTFLGMLTFVGAPVILWFLLTRRQMRSIWHL